MTLAEMRIRYKKCTPSDVGELAEISKTTFVEAFEKDNDPDDFQHYINTAFAGDTLTAQLENRNSFFYFAYAGDQLVGYFKLNIHEAQTDIKSADSVELERIYVSKAFQGKHIGQQMLAEAIRLSLDLNKAYLWLGVWEKNTDAIRFYRKHKFTKFDTHPYYIGKDRQTDWLMRYDLAQRATKNPNTMKNLRMLLMLLTLSLPILAAAQYYFPEKNETWVAKAPEDIGMNAAALDQAVRFAEDNEYSGSRDLRIAILKGFEREPYHKILGPTKKRGGPAGMILKNGYVVAQWGNTERVDMTFSVTKSFLSTMAGLAVDKGLIEGTNDKVVEYIWDGTFDGAHNAKITWEHLLQQNSAWSGELWGGKDWADRPPRQGGVDDWKFEKPNEPGTVMEYNDVRVNVLAYALTHVWRKPMPLVLKEEIMDPIGASTTWRWHGYENAWTEIDGIQMKSVTGGGHSGAGLFISAQDMARFGLLFLNDGKWKNEQLLSASWIEKAVSPSTPNVNYGYMWWLNKKGARHWKGLSEDIYYAAGFGGNFIVIDKEHDLVVVTRWLEPNTIGTLMTKINAAF